jgi:hypothetical protein
MSALTVLFLTQMSNLIRLGSVELAPTYDTHVDVAYVSNVGRVCVLYVRR